MSHLAVGIAGAATVARVAQVVNSVKFNCFCAHIKIKS